MVDRAVIFDLDGVLILSEAAHLQSWRAVAAARGVTLDAATFKACFGRTNRDCIRLLFGELPAATAAAIAEQKEQGWRAAIRGAVPLAPGAMATLTALAQAGFALALGSSAPAENVAAVLDGTGLRQLLPVTVDGGMVARGKPAPDVFLRAAELLGAAPGRCIVVEDAPAGITAAVAAGMVPVGLPTAHPPAALRAAGARIVLDALADLTPALATGLLPQRP